MVYPQCLVLFKSHVAGVNADRPVKSGALLLDSMYLFNAPHPYYHPHEQILIGF